MQTLLLTHIYICHKLIEYLAFTILQVWYKSKIYLLYLAKKSLAYVILEIISSIVILI